MRLRAISGSGRVGWRPRRWLLLAALAVAAPVGMAGQAAGDLVDVRPGQPAPDATLQDLDGNEVRLLDHAGPDATLIEFWASWCPHCRALRPQLEEIEARWGDRVSIVAVAVAVSQTLPDVRRHVEEHAPGHPFLWDGTGAAVRAYGASTTGVVVLLDDEGKVAYTGVGSDQDLVAAVEAMLGGG